MEHWVSFKGTQSQMSVLSPSVSFSTIPITCYATKGASKGEMF